MSYKVRWPVSLVLSKKSLTKYQLLFRHVFFAKHVQRLLSKNSWRDHQVRSFVLRGVFSCPRTSLSRVYIVSMLLSIFSLLPHKKRLC